MGHMLMRLLLLFLLAGSLATPAVASKKSRAAKASTTSSAWHPAVPFIEDDFGRALALAKERKLPVFIEGWAPL